MKLIDSLIHVDKQLNEKEKDNLVQRLRAMQGVIAPRFNIIKARTAKLDKAEVHKPLAANSLTENAPLNKNSGHLLLVLFNLDAIKPQDLLQEVRQQGYSAQLVGM